MMLYFYQFTAAQSTAKDACLAVVLAKRQAELIAEFGDSGAVEAASLATVNAYLASIGPGSVTVRAAKTGTPTQYLDGIFLWLVV